MSWLKYSIYFNVIIIFLIITKITDSNLERILRFQLNPDCSNDNCQNFTLAYINSSDPTSLNATVFNYLWFFSTGFKPTIFLFETTPNTRLFINWENLHSGENFIKFNNGTILNSFGIEITSIFFVDLLSKNLLYDIPIKNFHWNTNVTTTNSSVNVHFFNNDTDIGNFHFKIASFNHNGRDEELPRLLFSDSGNIIRFQMENFNFNNHLKNHSNIQLCANFTVAKEGDKSFSDIKSFTSINDEFTPGIFQVN